LFQFLVHAPNFWGNRRTCSRCLPPSSNLPRLGQSAISQSFSLARVRQAVATSARKGPACAVEQRDTTNTVAAVGLDVCSETTAGSHQVRRRPRDRHRLLDVFPSLCPWDPKHRDRRLPLTPNTDARALLSVTGPRDVETNWFGPGSPGAFNSTTWIAVTCHVHRNRNCTPATKPLPPGVRRCSMRR
jgi:hypothetical protein